MTPIVSRTLGFPVGRILSNPRKETMLTETLLSSMLIEEQVGLSDYLLNV